MLKYRNDLKEKSRQLRKSMTDAERSLWRHLCGKQVHGVQFYRQKPLGPYIVDFYAPAIKLVIEVDGSQHQEFVANEHDKTRDEYLKTLGLKVRRFDNRQVLCEVEGVMETLEQLVSSIVKKIPLSPPFSKGEVVSPRSSKGEIVSAPFSKGEGQ